MVLVALLGLVMAGCLIRGARSEPEPDVKRVVYLGIEHATPALDQAVADRVDPGYERVSAEEYRETARKLNAEGMIDLDMARVAQALDVDVIIHGEYVRKNRRRGQLTVTMRTAAIGEVVGEYVVPVRRGAITKRGARQLDSELRAELEALLGPPPAPPAEPAGATASTEADQAADAPEELRDEKPGRAGATPAAPKPGRAEATPAAAPKPGRAGATPAAAQKPGRADKATARSSRTSSEPAEGQPDATRSQPEPRAPAPVIHQDDSGQVIDDEKPPAPK